MRRSLQMALGQHRGNFTQRYQKAVVRSGGRFSRKDYALDIVNDFFYGRHSTSAGFYSLSAGLHKFTQLWAAVSDAISAHIPVWGIATTSIGFVPGDWSASLGLQCGSGKALNSNILASSIAQDTGGIFAFGSSRVSTTNQTLIGAKNAGTATNVSQANSRNSTQMQAAYQRNSTSQPAITADNAFIMTSRTESATFQCYAVASGTMTKTDTSATSVANPSVNYFYGARNNGADTPEGVYSQRLLEGGILNEALSGTGEAEIIYKACVALNTARASL